MVANARNITEVNPFASSANLCWSMGTSATRKRPRNRGYCRFPIRSDRRAGKQCGHFIPKTFTEYTTEDLNALVSTTLAGFLYVSQLAVKRMLQQKSGSIVNVSTALVDQPIAGVPVTVQVMAKGSLHAVTRALAIEYANDGIRVNTVALGVIKTPMHKPETYESLKGLHPMGRMGEIKEVVDAVLFLTDATFTTGEILHVDGGVHAGKW